MPNLLLSPWRNVCNLLRRYWKWVCASLVGLVLLQMLWLSCGLFVKHTFLENSSLILSRLASKIKYADDAAFGEATLRNFAQLVKERVARDAAVRRNTFMSRGVQCSEDQGGSPQPLGQSCALQLGPNKLAEKCWDFDFLNAKLQEDWQEMNKLQKEETSNQNSNQKKFMLIWNESRVPRRYGHCPYCSISNTSSLVSPDQVDAIFIESYIVLRNSRLLHIVELPTREMFPNAKMVIYESSDPLYRSAANYLDGLVDYTLGYRRDSDVVKTNGYITPRKEPVAIETILSVNTGKTKMAAWFASNCSTSSKRDELVRTLMKHGVEVDIYGLCGNLSCPRDSPACYEMLQRDYKFYFAFENSLCNHYITEKFFRALAYYVVPVTYGLGHELTGAPKDSYIDVFDFVDAKSLADYIIYLHSNITAYNEYSKWRQFYEVERGNKHSLKLCQICKRLALGTAPETQFQIFEYEAWLKEDQCINVENGSKISNFVHGLP